jgi:hypothetical protein
MHKFESDTHRMELSQDGIINVFQLDGRVIQEVTYNGAKVKTAEHTAETGSPILRNLLTAMDSAPVFRAAFAANGVFHVDYETGTQRWKGYEPTKEVKEKLLKCGFNDKSVEMILMKCKQNLHPSLPKVK